ncbi:MAG: transaldolase family protein [Kiritimatiellae bacterium]|nr:transaldolase family protein [Kiritimatiellia bacterium]
MNNKALAAKVRELVTSGFSLKLGEPTHKGAPNKVWQSAVAAGSELWFDTGDLEEAAKVWTAEFSGLTTNNSLLNKEIQKGIYDQLIRASTAALRATDANISERDLLLETAFILNAHHALRLVQTFDAHVSVELHTDLANDVERTVSYGKRYFEICPERFFVKVPLTPAGLISARRLGEAGVPINFTLGYSARQNYLIALFSQTSYVNVFMGRLNSFVADSKLGDGQNVGEKATLATAREIIALRKAGKSKTKLIGASIRSGDQVAAVAGVDVLTIPTKAAAEFAAKGEPARSHVQEDPHVTLADGVKMSDFGGAALWEVSDQFKAATDALLKKDTATLTPEKLQEHFASAEIPDFLPRWSEDDLQTITKDGKIPNYSTWKARLASGQVGLDALMNISGLCAFTVDQAALDNRVRSLL